MGKFIYVYFEEKSISEEQEYYSKPIYYASLDRLLDDHPEAKPDGCWTTGEVYQVGKIID